MDRKGGLRLDPDALGLGTAEGNTETRTPLSDLYELPVFANASEQKAKECRKAERQRLEVVRQRIFKTDAQGDEAWVQEIYSQIFAALPNRLVSEPMAADCLSEPAITGHTASDSGDLRGMGIFLIMMVIGIVLVSAGNKSDMPGG